MTFSSLSDRYHSDFAGVQCDFYKDFSGKNCIFHTTANRLAGGLLFLLPFAGKLACFRALAALVCAVALFATVQEGCRIRRAGR